MTLLHGATWRRLTQWNAISPQTKLGELHPAEGSEVYMTGVLQLDLSFKHPLL